MYFQAICPQSHVLFVNWEPLYNSNICVFQRLCDNLIIDAFLLAFSKYIGMIRESFVLDNPDAYAMYTDVIFSFACLAFVTVEWRQG